MMVNNHTGKGSKMTEHLPEHTKTMIDLASVVTAVGAFFNALPAIAALFSLIWTILRIVEMITGKTINQIIEEFKHGRK